MFKKIISLLSACAIAFGTAVYLPDDNFRAAAQEMPYGQTVCRKNGEPVTAKAVFASSGWTVSDFDSKIEVVRGSNKLRIKPTNSNSVEIEGYGADVFCIDLEDTVEEFPNMALRVEKVTLVSKVFDDDGMPVMETVTDPVTGEETEQQKLSYNELKDPSDTTEPVALDYSKIITGDLEEKGNLRMELYNNYGVTKESSPFKGLNKMSYDYIDVDFFVWDDIKAARDVIDNYVIEKERAYTDSGNEIVPLCCSEENAEYPNVFSSCWDLSTVTGITCYFTVDEDAYAETGYFIGSVSTSGDKLGWTPNIFSSIGVVKDDEGNYYDENHDGYADTGDIGCDYITPIKIKEGLYAVTIVNEDGFFGAYDNNAYLIFQNWTVDEAQNPISVEFDHAILNPSPDEVFLSNKIETDGTVIKQYYTQPTWSRFNEGNKDGINAELSFKPMSEPVVEDEYAEFDVYLKMNAQPNTLQFAMAAEGGEIMDFTPDADNLRKIGYDEWLFTSELTDEQKEQFPNVEEYQFVALDDDYEETDFIPEKGVRIGIVTVRADGTSDTISITTTPRNNANGKPGGLANYNVTEKANWSSVAGSVEVIDLTDGLDLAHFNVVFDKKLFSYDGKAQMPEVFVMRGDEVLTQGQDYSISVANNIDVGTATVTVKGKGDYKGIKKARFLITETFIPSGSFCGSNMVWSFNEENGILTVEGFGNMNDYEADDVPWLDYKDDIKEVYVKDGVMGLGNNAFSGCTALEKVFLPDTLKKIGDYAFYDDENLGDIVFPDKLNSLGMYALAGTKWLSDKQKEDPMVIVNGMLIDGSNCSGDVVIPEGVEQIQSYSFSKNSKITSVKMANTVTRIGEKAFEKCSKLMTIEIPESVSHIYADAFSGCPEDMTIMCKKGTPAERFAFNQKIKYELKQDSIEGCRIVLTPAEFEYEGVPCEPMTEVWVNNVKLSRGIDYEVEYVDNDAPGTATVIITGINNFCGTEKITFEIKGEEIMLGDVNGDGMINVSDISLMAAYIKGIKSLEDAQLTAADVNRNGELNVSDLSMVAAHVKGKKFLDTSAYDKAPDEPQDDDEVTSDGDM